MSGRAELLERYNALPLPTTKDEHWRFTDLKGFDPDGWDAASAPAAAPASLLELDVAASATITESVICAPGAVSKEGPRSCGPGIVAAWKSDGPAPRGRAAKGLTSCRE